MLININQHGENIADNGGLRESYLAYQNYVAQYGVEPRLPGLEEFTPNQIFFLSNANIWCSTMTDEALLNQVSNRLQFLFYENRTKGNN